MKRFNAAPAGPIKAIGLLCLSALALALTAAPAFAAPPAPAMVGVSNVSYLSAEGEVDLNTPEFGWYFQVSTNGTDWQQRGPVYGPVADETDTREIPELAPGTHYFVRVVNYFYGEDTPSPNSVEITTLPVDPPKVLSIDNASSVSYTTATAKGKVERPANTNPAFNLNCYFEFVTEQQFTNAEFAEAGQIECDGGPIKTPGVSDVTATLSPWPSGLNPGTKYHLRLRVTNPGGEDKKVAAATFTTPPVTPPKVISISQPTEIKNSSALFHGEVERPANPDPAFEINLCGFELVTHEQFLISEFESPQFGFGCGEGSSYPAGSPKVLAIRGGTYVGYDVLPPETTFHVRLAVGNLGGLDRKVLPTTFTTLPQPAPPAVTISAPTSLTARSAHIAGTVDAGGSDPLQQPFWRFECTPECSAAGGSSLSGEFYPPENGPKTVQADIKLKANTSYEIKLVARNYGGPGYVGPDNATAPVSFKTPITISAKTGSATVTSTSAGIAAEVDPGGALTTYKFEYGLDDQYGQSSAVKTLVASDSRASVRANISGLSPATTYHYRVVASNGAGEVQGEDRTFTTVEAASEENCANKPVRVQQKSTTLPECRAYEIVNNPSGEVGDINRVPQIQEDGGAAGWITTTPGKEVSGNILVSTVVGRRTDSGWVQEDANIQALQPTHALNASNPVFFSSDLKQLMTVGPAPADPDDVGESTDFYKVDVGSGGKGTWITRQEGASLALQNFGGAAEDLSTVILAYPYRSFQIWATSNGVDHELVNIGVDGNPIPEAMPVANGNNVSQNEARNPVSTDARFVFFNPFSWFEATPLLVRDRVAKTTIEVSASQRAGEVGASKGGRFLNASPDGEVVYFLSSDQLTDSATNKGGIYRFNISTKELTLVTPPVGAANGIEPGEWLMPESSKSIFYFTSPHALAPGSEEGAFNVYVVDGTETSLVATVPNTGPEGPALQLTRVNRDGRFALMGTTASIDGAPNNKRGAIYEYDHQTGNVACVSCRPNGAKSQGSANLQQFPLVYPNCCTASRNITDDGGVFFASTDQLLPADETPSQDVYYYHHGTLSLMSTGKGDKDNYVGENTHDGSTVFIITRSALVPEDVDAEEQDIYAVRVGGGFFRQPSAGALCQGEACRTNPSQAPPASAPATPSFIGADNSQSGRNQARKKKKKDSGKKHGGKKNGKGSKKGKRKKKGKRNGNGRTGR